MVDPRPTYNNKFMFQKIYTELDYLAGGILQIPAGAEKPTKPAKDNSYVRCSRLEEERGRAGER
jgi:centromere protein C